MPNITHFITTNKMKIILLAVKKTLYTIRGTGALNLFLELFSFSQDETN